MKELKLEELTTRQKLGMCFVAHIYDYTKWGIESEKNTQYALDLVKEHALGAAWVDPDHPKREEIMKALHEADYPVLIITDAESGIGGHFVGQHNAIGCTGDEELAYMFGKVTAATAQKMGYNVVCDPVVDMTNKNAVCGATTRSLGGDKYQVAKLAIAEAKGMHDGGVLSVAKHYPSAKGNGEIDSHMAENLATETKEELLDYNLFPYLALLKEGLLDGIMTGHTRLPEIDPDYPASLSQKVINVIREQGFDGFAITDALSMMGIVAKFGATTSKGLAIANGNELALTWGDNKEGFDAICETYEKGLIADERLNEAARRVLEAQHKTTLLPKNVELTDADLEKFERINTDSTYAILDDGLTESISREGKHYFVVLAEQSTDLNSKGEVNVDTMTMNWYNPRAIMERLKELFPNSTATAINEFSSAGQNMRVLEGSVSYDDVIFVTFVMGQAYVGKECFTSRTTSLIQALQVTDRVSTVVHFGNPFVLEDLVHIPRILVGGKSKKNVEHTLEILAGMHPAKGVPTYKVNLK